MPYVMVPVPEEHEQELMQEILKMTLRVALSAWEPGPLRAVLEASEPKAREVITLLARSSARNEKLTRRQVAAAVAVDLAAVRTMTEEVNARCHAQSLPFLILTAPGAEGDVDDQQLLITQVAADQLVAMVGADDGPDGR